MDIKLFYLFENEENNDGPFSFKKDKNQEEDGVKDFSLRDIKMLT
jgi:hypothetical protein